MEGIYKKTPPPYMKLSLAALIVCGLYFCFHLLPLGLLCLWGAGSIIYYTVKEPDCAYALQSDERRRQEAERQNIFCDALYIDGILDDYTTSDDVKVESPEPFVYEVELRQQGKTEDGLRRACEKSLNAMGCVSVDVERTAPSTYRITYSTQTPIEQAAALSCSFDDLPKPKGLDALPVGIYPDGSPVLFNLESRNGLIAGVPGSGKSVLLRALICQLLQVPGVPVRLAILSPKSLDFQAFASYARIISDPAEMLQYLDDLQQESEARKAWCVANGKTRITPSDCTPEMPAIVTIVDEFAVIKARTTTDEKGKTVKIGQQIEGKVFELIAECRFACFSTVIALQKASGASGINTDLRDIISGQRVQFQAETRESVQMVMGDLAEYAPCQDITRDQAGVGFISQGDRPRVFKGAYATEEDERRIVRERGRR